jgi:hypothetical protein
MRLLVCGSRSWKDDLAIADAISQLDNTSGIQLLIQGGARGADRMARSFANSAGIPVKEFPANWNRYGKAAGFIRNQQMLDEGRPHLVLAFLRNDSPGTLDMIRRAAKADIPVAVVRATH